MNRAVPLAWRLGHDGDAGIQQVVAYQFQISMTATKKPREFFLEAIVYVIECFLKAGTSLAINFSNSVFQRLQRITQIGILCIQVLFSLKLLLVFSDRRQIDRTKTIYPADQENLNDNEDWGPAVSVASAGNQWLGTKYVEQLKILLTPEQFAALPGARRWLQQDAVLTEVPTSEALRKKRARYKRSGPAGVGAPGAVDIPTGTGTGSKGLPEKRSADD